MSDASSHQPGHQPGHNVSSTTERQPAHRPRHNEPGLTASAASTTLGARAKQCSACHKFGHLRVTSRDCDYYQPRSRNASSSHGTLQDPGGSALQNSFQSSSSATARSTSTNDFLTRTPCSSQNSSQSDFSVASQSASQSNPSETGGNTRSPSGHSSARSKAFHATWQKLSTLDPELLSREEASEVCGINAGARQHVNSVVVKTRAMLERECRIPATECDLFLALLGHDSIDMLLRAMTCSMKRDDKKKQVEEWEFYSFLAQILWATGASKMSKEHAFHWLTLLMEAKTEYGRGAILTLSRFNFLQKHLRGFQDEGDATRAAHQDVSDMARQMHPLEQTIADPTLKLFGDKYLRVTIDDRNRGTVLAGNPVNTCRPRKRHRNGAGSDASADAVFRVKLFSILYDRSYHQVTVLTKILETIKEKIGGDVAGIEVCLNRGNPSPALYELCAKLGYSLIVVNDTEKQQGCPFLSATAARERPSKYASRGWSIDGAMVNISSQFVIDDKPTLGGQIFAAKKSLTCAAKGRKVTAYAYAVREFGNAKHTHIQRFVTILPAEMMQRFRNGFVFETYGRLRRDIAAQVLFYPEPEVQSLGEDFLDSPRFQDASAGSIDTDFGGLESEEGEEEEEDEEEEVERRAVADSAQGNDSFVESDLNSDEDSTFARDNSVVDLGDEELNECARDALDKIRDAERLTRTEVESFVSACVNPLTAGQRCADWFIFRMLMITGTTAHDIAKETSACRPFLFEDPARAKAVVDLSSSALSETLCKSWFHVKRGNESQRKRALLLGTLNETGIVAQLRKMTFVDAVFDIGLVQKKGRPGLGVSADGIIIIRPPNSLSHAERVVAPLEIKTKVASRTLSESSHLGRKYGIYVHCIVGSPAWFDLVPKEHRGQLLHQASVFDVPFGVYCVGSTRKIMYVVLIQYPAHVRAKWLSAFEDVERRFLNWAYVDSSGSEAPSIPEYYTSGNREVLQSRLPLWRVYHARRKDKGIFMPVRLTRSLVQFYYSASKQGVDGLDDYAEHFDSRALKVNWEQKITLGLITDVFINSLVVWRMCKVYDPSMWVDLRKFLTLCSRRVRLTDFLEKVVFGLLAHAEKLKSRDMAVPEPDVGALTTSSSIQNASRGYCLSREEHEQLRLPNGKRGIIGLANTAALKRLRLSSNIHKHESTKTAPNCVVCGKGARTRCTFCNVVLHRQLRHSVNQAVSCWDQWHSNQIVKRRDYAKKSDSRSNSSE